MRHVETLYAECFEVDLAVENTLAKVVATSSLDDVHNDRGKANSDEQDGQYDDKEDPETGKLTGRVWVEC